MIAGLKGETVRLIGLFALRPKSEPRALVCCLHLPLLTYLDATCLATSCTWIRYNMELSVRFFEL